MSGRRDLLHMDTAGPGTQTLDGNPGQVERPQHLEYIEQHDRLLDQQADPQQGITDMHQNSATNTDCRQQ